jgi:predicted deacylase
MSRLSLTTLALLVAAASAAAQRDPHVTVGSAVAHRGETATGVIAIAATTDSATNLPVAVINGARPGPVLALVAGSHGTEYTSIVALQRLIGRLDPKTISGTVIVAPLLNVASFTQMRVHLNPIDLKGMNGQYPGDTAGTQTQRALAAIAVQVVQQADVVVDLHGGDLDEDLRPYSYWFRGGNAAQDSASRALVLAFGLDHIIVHDFDLADAASRRNLGGYAMSLGKTVLVAEAGRTGVVATDEVDMLVDGVLNTMGALHMIERRVRPVTHPVWLDASTRLGADSGMFFATAARGSRVTEGMEIGYTTDYFGRRTGTIKAPVAGVITFIRGVPSLWKGATVAVIGKELEEVPPYRKP